MIRPARTEDTPTLLDIARGTGVFKPLEIGFAYYAPTAMTDNTWYLYWIAVSKQVQARGTGATLLRHAEDDARQAGARLFLLETSSLPHYELTRRFYRKHGYDREAVLR